MGLSTPITRGTKLSFFVRSRRNLLTSLGDSLFLFCRSTLHSQLTTILDTLLHTRNAVGKFRHCTTLCLRRRHHRDGIKTNHFHPDSINNIRPRSRSVLSSFPTRRLHVLSRRQTTFRRSIHRFRVSLSRFFLRLRGRSRGLPATSLVVLLSFGQCRTHEGNFSRHGCYTMAGWLC